jgi:hypothetical protein
VVDCSQTRESGGPNQTKIRALGRV